MAMNFSHSNRRTHLATFLCLSVVSLFTWAAKAEQVSNWEAYLEPHPNDDDTKYRLVFEWDHIQDETIFVDGENGGKVTNAENDPRCNGDSSIVASDGAPYWMPRFFPRPVSEEITRVTGVKFASADWQPCGHKEITICHAESHYDFHMYYEDESVMNAMPMCDIGVPTNPDLPVCQDSATSGPNHDYFRLINHSIPLSLSASSSNGTLEKAEMDFCVDPSSAILRSGIHYGDASETLQEWKTPVTIVGSHDCQLKFFEPMFSWKWASGCVPEEQTSWPVFEVANIQYTKKGIESLPDSWRIEVSEACKATSCSPGRMEPPSSDVCHIKLTTEGDKCPESGCTLLRECGTINDCSTGKTYVSPRNGAAEAVGAVGAVEAVGAVVNSITTGTSGSTATKVPEASSKCGSLARDEARGGSAGRDKGCEAEARTNNRLRTRVKGVVHKPDEIFP